MLDSEDRCSACEKKVSESSSCRDFNIKLYVEAEGKVCSVKAWASHFDDGINKAEDLDAELENLNGKKVQIDCDGDMEPDEPLLEAVRLVIG